MAKKKLDNSQKKSTRPTKTRKKAEGLGDTVEQVLEATGVAKVAKWIMGEDCGCDARKERLNYLFPYRKPNCLTEAEYNYLSDYYELESNVVSGNIQKELLAIYNRVFNDNRTVTSCSSCFKSKVHDKLKTIYKEYESDKEQQ